MQIPAVNRVCRHSYIYCLGRQLISLVSFTVMARLRAVINLCRFDSVVSKGRKFGITPVLLRL